MVVEVGARRYLSSSIDISTHGAKVKTNARVKPGTAVRLEIAPPEGPPIRVEALAWRVDADGVAFLFSRNIQHRSLRAAHSAPS